MKSHAPERVISGTHGEMWIDGDYMAEVTSCEAKLTLKKQPVTQVKVMGEGQKIMGAEGKGSFKLNKVSSYMTLKVASKLKEGKTVSSTIISKLDDPDAFGAERIMLKNCVFDEVTLVDWEAGKLGEESHAFTFNDFELLDTIS